MRGTNWKGLELQAETKTVKNYKNRNNKSRYGYEEKREGVEKNIKTKLEYDRGSKDSSTILNNRIQNGKSRNIRRKLSW